jgi:hypothetical protein
MNQNVFDPFLQQNLSAMAQVLGLLLATRL